MIVYRLARRAFSEDFSGAGAEKLGGRWNSKGMPMLYTASSRALCLTEWLVHTPALLLPDDLVMVSLVYVPPSIVNTGGRRCMVEEKCVFGFRSSFGSGTG